MIKEKKKDFRERTTSDMTMGLIIMSAKLPQSCMVP